MAYAEINYGFGNARFWGQFKDDKELRIRFHELANQCFGIRKSIAGYEVTKLDLENDELPNPWHLIEGATTVLKHSGGDTIVWGADGKKIKSEWD